MCEDITVTHLNLPFQGLDSNSRVGCERCSRIVKKTKSRRESTAGSTLVRFEQTLHLFECFYGRFMKSK